MDNSHILDLEAQRDQLVSIFEKIQSGNAILFLGAGASVTDEKIYLSKQVINYYEDYLGKSYNESDITRFVDILSADPNFDREHFDQEVEKYLRKLNVTKGHKILSTIPWREILTTNYDLLLEKAYDEMNGKNDFELYPIRSKNKLNHRQANNQIRYVKLNGCISDKSEYPLVFSSDDFKKSNSFYKTVLNSLKSVSPEILFISIGYSFSDPLGRQILEKFDSYNFRQRKWIINVDPYPNENYLSYYTQQRVKIVQTSFSGFFNSYHEWEESQLERVVKRRGQSFTTSKNSQISLTNKLRIQLDGVVKQLNSNVSERIISDKDFFEGEEPNYKVILNRIDVFREQEYSRIQKEIFEKLKVSSSQFLPIYFITGGFGIGKSTFTLRLIHEITSNDSLDAVAFELEDFTKLKKEYLIELFNKVNAKNIILYCDEIEIDSSFKSLIEIRRDLSIEQFVDFNVLLIAPIRENILNRQLQNRNVKEVYNIEIGSGLADNELRELLEKLKAANLIEYRTEGELKNLINKVKSKYNGDSFLTLLELVTSGKHINDLISAYNQLSDEAKKAFVNTALLHQYKMSFPASWLKDTVSLEWDDFITKVVQTEGKGILIQEKVVSYGNEPDLFFKTKHPVIAKRLIENIIPTKDKQYKRFENILRKVDLGSTNSRIVTNLLKELRLSGTFSGSQIDKLYDIAYRRLDEDAFFLLNYAINLQNRCDERSLEKGLKQLIYAESLLDKRDHKFIHRRGVINFELAKLFFDKEAEDELNRTFSFLKEAKSLFHVKQLMDPFSSYSYVDFIRLLIWEISKLNHDEETELLLRIQIQELFDLASRAVVEEVDRIDNLRSQYANYLKSVVENREYKEHLDELYSDADLRPYACILLFSYYEDLDSDESEGRLEELIDEMKNYLYNNEVVKFLFKYHGRKLYDSNNRVYLFELARKHDFLEEELPLRYHYYKFIAECYNRNFGYGYGHLRQIENKYNGMNPEFNIIWSDSDENIVRFDAIVIKGEKFSRKAVKVSDFQRTFGLIKGDYSDYSIGEKVKVELHFFIYGVKARIVKDEA